MYKVTPSKKWLERALRLEEGADIHAGPRVKSPEEGTLGHGALRRAFPIVLRKLRLRAGLSVEKLARKADVEVEQLQYIEHDPAYKAPPRTIVQLAKFFKVTPKVFFQLAGATKEVDERLEESVVRFAAESESFEKLTKEEKKLLGELVKVLQEYE